jgi:hypothetical protein
MCLFSWRISFEIPHLDQMNLSKIILMKLIDHHQSVPLFYSSMKETLYRFNLFCKSY